MMAVAGAQKGQLRRHASKYTALFAAVLSMTFLSSGLLALDFMLPSSTPSKHRVAEHRVAGIYSHRPADSQAIGLSTAVSRLGAVALAGIALCISLGRRDRRQVGRGAFPVSGEHMDFFLNVPGATELVSTWQHSAESFAPGSANAARILAQGLSEPAYAEEVPQTAAPAVASVAPLAGAATAAAASVAPAAPVLDPNVKYLMGADGNVLLDPMNNKPLTDDWWNSFVGFQADMIVDIDAKLREASVPEAFGWTIILYTVLVKTLFFPLQQGQLRSTSMMQLLSPKVKEIQEKFKDDPETMQKMVAQLYSVLDVNPLGGCLPTLLQLPIFWSLYGVWRRLAAERFPFYEESWLFVPSLAKPNPDFQFKYDWLFEFTNGAPTMGWHDYLGYLVLPAILIGASVIQQEQAKANRQPSEAEQNNVVLQVLPLISIYFIGSLSLQLPQAVSVYYATNTALSLAQTSWVKYKLREEIPGYAEFEKTGKFPDSAFDDIVRQSTPVAKTLHEAALQGDVNALERMLSINVAEDEEPSQFDINGWDDKQIPPMGYAVACGHIEALRFFLKRGADLKRLDGQDNSFLHYAAGYGQLESLKELLAASKETWPNNEWSELRNGKGQSVLDAARVNKKGSVLDFLRQTLGLESETPWQPAASISPPSPALAAPGPAAPAAPAPALSDMDAAKMAQARAALLASVENAAKLGVNPAAAPGLLPSREALQNAVAQMKQNPKAVEQAKKMMGSIPPQLLAMMSGGKMSAEDVQKELKVMESMSMEELLEKSEAAAQRFSATLPTDGKDSTGSAQPAVRSARSVD